MLDSRFVSRGPDFGGDIGNNEFIKVDEPSNTVYRLRSVDRRKASCSREPLRRCGFAANRATTRVPFIVSKSRREHTPGGSVISSPRREVVSKVRSFIYMYIYGETDRRAKATVTRYVIKHSREKQITTAREIIGGRIDRPIRRIYRRVIDSLLPRHLGILYPVGTSDGIMLASDTGRSMHQCRPIFDTDFRPR